VRKNRRRAKSPAAGRPAQPRGSYKRAGSVAVRRFSSIDSNTFSSGPAVSHPDYPSSPTSQRDPSAAQGNGDAAPAEDISQRLGSLKFEKSHFTPTVEHDAEPRNYGRLIVSGLAAIAVIAILSWGWSFLRSRGIGGQLSAAALDGANPTEVVAVTAISNNGGDGPRLSVSGYVVAESKVQVPVKVTGTVVDLPIVEGTKVSAGDLLVKLDSQEYEIDLKEAQASTEAAKARLDELLLSRTEEMKQTQADIEKAEAQHELAERDLDRYQKLGDSASAQERDKAQTNVRETAARLKQLKVVLQSADTGARRQQINAAKAELKRATAAQEKAQYLVDCTKVVAENDGTILEKFFEPGESIKVDPATGAATVCTMANLHNLLSEVEVHERDLEQVEVGQRCWVSPEAAPELIYEARVERRSPVVNRQRGSVQVKVRILEADEKLMPDMSCKVTFLTGDQSPSSQQGVEIPQVAVVMQGTSPVIFVPDGGVARQRSVTIGKTRDQMVEIASGLHAGDKVLVSHKPLVDGQPIHFRVK
jgi:HlyD family secretion protein